MANDNLKQNITPRWKGFNLVDIFSTGFSRYPRLGPYYFKEDDFRMIADWGFDFVRLPLSYRCLTSSEYPFVLSEEGIAKIDEAVAFGEKYGIHINLCLHRAPGFCINDDELEPFGWLDYSPAKDYFCRMWCDFARHYKGVSSNQLSFNFINEPDEKSRIGPNLTRPAYAELMLRLIKEVHAIDPERHCVFDGWRASVEPMPELAGIPNTSHSMHCYYPFDVTHYNLDGKTKHLPEWPTHAPENVYWDRTALEVYVKKWVGFSVRESVGIHVGECGCLNHTPHDVMMAWADDLFSLFKQYNLGFALWNFRGNFGILKKQPNPGTKRLKPYGEWFLDVDFLQLLQRY